MIDLASEQLISFRQVPQYLPRRPNDRPIHVSAIYRWATKGVRGGGVLESLRIGGTTYTSIEALQRFAERLTANHPETATPISRLTRTRQAQARQAAKLVHDQLKLQFPCPQPPASAHTPEHTAARCKNNAQLRAGQAVDGFTRSIPTNKE